VDFLSSSWMPDAGGLLSETQRSLPSRLVMKGRCGRGKTFILLFLLLLLFPACSSRQDVVLRLSHITSPTSSWQKGAERFAELVEKRSGGKIRVRVYPAGQLANHNQQGELKMLGSGSIDMALVSPIILALYLDPRFDLFGLPWLFPDHATARQVLDGPIGQKVLSFLPPKGLQGLAYGVNGFRQITNSVRPIRAPDDLRGLRCRVAGSRMYFRTLQLLGADALTMNFGEVFTSLQQGVIDAQENPLSIIFSSKLYEVQPYLTIWNYSYDPLILIMNRSRWKTFSSQDQTLLLDCAREAMSYQTKIVEEEDRTLPQRLREKQMKVTILSKDEIEPFRERVQPVYSEYKKIIGEKLVDQCLKEIATISSKQ
jgi:tripartite ATP-independent transporter DctP family solute receptor